MTREEAIQEFQNVKDLIRQDGKDWFDERDLEIIDMAIEALQADTVSREDTVTLNSPVIIQAEMVAVVRCKECKHQEHCYQTVSHTKIHDDFQEHWSETIEWCSRGERKGGDDE